MIINAKYTTWKVIRITGVIAAIGFSVAGFVWFYGNRASQVIADEQYREPASVEVTVTRAGEIDPRQLFHSYRGEIRSRRSSNLAMRRSGRLAEVLVEEGDRVERGDALARLDTSDIEVQKEIAEAEIAAASASLDEAIAGPRTQTLRSAAAKVRQLESQLASAENILRRQQTLSKRNAGTEQELDNARFSVEAFQANVAAAAAELEELQEGTRMEQIAAARAKLDVAKATRKQLGVDEEDSRIVAPYDGVIAIRNMDEGEMIGPHQMVLKILEVDPVEAHFGVPANVTRSWKVGDQWWIAIGSEQQTPSSSKPRSTAFLTPTKSSSSISLSLKSLASSDAGFMIGEISRMQPQVDPITRTRGVDLIVRQNRISEDCGSDLYIGQTATLWVPWDSSKSSHDYWVPTDALVRGSRGLWSIYVAVEADANHPNTTDNAVIERREVEIVRTAGAFSSVRGMIQRGDQIVTEGANQVGPGVHVRIHRSRKEISPTSVLKVKTASDRVTAKSEIGTAR